LNMSEEQSPLDTPVQPEIPQLHASERADSELSRDPGSSGYQAKKSGGRPKSFVWQYYTQHTDANVKSKRCEVSCNFCETRMLSRVEQMEAHLAHSCPKSPPEVKHHMTERLVAAKEASKARKEAQERGDVLTKAMQPGIQQAMASSLPMPLAKRLKMDTPKDHNMIPLRLRFPQVNTAFQAFLLDRAQVSVLCMLVPRLCKGCGLFVNNRCL
jgi:hypothetical protein